MASRYIVNNFSCMEVERSWTSSSGPLHLAFSSRHGQRLTETVEGAFATDVKMLAQSCMPGKRSWSPSLPFEALETSRSGSGGM